MLVNCAHRGKFPLNLVPNSAMLALVVLKRTPHELVAPFVDQVLPQLEMQHAHLAPPVLFLLVLERAIVLNVDRVAKRTLPELDAHCAAQDSSLTARVNANSARLVKCPPHLVPPPACLALVEVNRMPPAAAVLCARPGPALKKVNFVNLALLEPLPPDLANALVLSVVPERRQMPPDLVASCADLDSIPKVTVNVFSALTVRFLKDSVPHRAMIAAVDLKPTVLELDVDFADQDFIRRTTANVPAVDRTKFHLVRVLALVNLVRLVLSRTQQTVDASSAGLVSSLQMVEDVSDALLEKFLLVQEQLPATNVAVAERPIAPQLGARFVLLGSSPKLITTVSDVLPTKFQLALVRAVADHVVKAHKQTALKPAVSCVHPERTHREIVPVYVALLVRSRLALEQLNVTSADADEKPTQLELDVPSALRDHSLQLMADANCALQTKFPPLQEHVNATTVELDSKQTLPELVVSSANLVSLLLMTGSVNAAQPEQ